MRLQRILHGLASPVYLTSPPGDTRLFVVEKCGVIRIDRGGRLLRRPFLNITRNVSCVSEEGLLSMAFDPDYKHNGFFYVDFSNADGNTRVARYRIERLHPNIANPSSKVILRQGAPAVRQPQGRPARSSGPTASSTSRSATAAARAIPTSRARAAARSRPSCA